MKSNRTLIGGHQGLTLMELLTVIAVIGVLTGMLFPVVARATEQARRTTCLSRLRQLSAAHHLYLQDWDEQLPPWSFTSRPIVYDRQFPFVAWPPIEDREQTCWTVYLQLYLGSSRASYDPSAWATRSRLGTTWLADYTMLTWGPGGRGTEAAPYWRWPGQGSTLTSVTRPGETLILIEGISTTQTTWLEAGRHGDGVNAAFLDGHVRWLPPRELERADTDGRGFYWLRYATIDR